ncbi:MAG: tRNA (guanosine(18)-2'-O)-methyltransferase TrmH [Gammaproteobacteria bacterium]|nr:tRNA (guanosine(18)-2'-O)-methyltransferase TrmH [Gammaproteobacteria bacterium]NIM72773.1 tRNA (guanosine(18)-2'-O)-methyltransferase TrmH [Gammaproteobacteria bacterium]NIN38230.1 tRNA (guanosine(18)-2'-O)-methyltransferase TrmH [Gammaproteobacteria bacterium]NIO24521.1 tRNA (guanosine(18)-2'-O)-methyltransferase TrmH [Gammaproteobacteria bacterium]NIO65130.1 tRNA (guanosine(18)-2'-O)-methyltransferase TrmH [Gammaproteobacteria bacterium]
MTPQRFKKLRRVLDSRQPDLTVLLDNVHKAHNFSAILRSCDAVGVFEAHAVWPDPTLRPSHLTSGGTRKWVGIRTHPDIDSALAELRERGFQLIAAHPAENARDYRDVDYTRPTALVLGAELEGLGGAALAGSDLQICVPMMGMVESLNVSVAAATILFEAQRQRASANLYAESRLKPEVYASTLFEWAHPAVARYCRRRGFAYPELDEDGEISGPIPTR